VCARWYFDSTAVSLGPCRRCLWRVMYFFYWLIFLYSWKIFEHSLSILSKHSEKYINFIFNWFISAYCFYSPIYIYNCPVFQIYNNLAMNSLLHSQQQHYPYTLDSNHKNGLNETNPTTHTSLLVPADYLPQGEGRLDHQTESTGTKSKCRYKYKRG